MVAFLLRPAKVRWRTISFPSTLYLQPILELLLKDVAPGIKEDLRLGLQEALVNAAKHGNQLDPSKSVIIQYGSCYTEHQWLIRDQGVGFLPPLSCHVPPIFEQLPDHQCECGRGLFILFQTFDRVAWNESGTELHLAKYLP